MWAYESVFTKFIQLDFAVHQPKMTGFVCPVSESSWNGRII